MNSCISLKCHSKVLKIIFMCSLVVKLVMNGISDVDLTTSGVQKIFKIRFCSEIFPKFQPVPL